MGYARKDVEKTKKIAKKFVRYQEGAELYSIGLTKFQELAKEAKAVYKIDKVALVNSGLRREEKIVEGRKTGIDFLSYENYNEDVEE